MITQRLFISITVIKILNYPAPFLGSKIKYSNFALTKLVVNTKISHADRSTINMKYIKVLM